MLCVGLVYDAQLLLIVTSLCFVRHSALLERFEAINNLLLGEYQ